MHVRAHDPRLARAFARLDSLVNWERRDRGGMRVGLEPVLDVLARLGHPERSFRAVHVAGTKGKGTTSALVAAALSRAGTRTGLYTSPHVDRVNERVRIDGLEVDDAALAETLERAWAAREAAIAGNTPGDEATWFDLVTSAAFVCFQRARCEWGVVECGIGGRLDSTNAVQGEVCVVTNVDLEHTSVLGNTRADIAREKGGILKRGSTLVTSLWPDPALGRDDDAGSVLEGMACELGCRVLRPRREEGTMLARNVALARLVLDELGRRGVTARDGRPVDGRLLDEETISGARLPARLEKRRIGRTLVVIDGAHVASSVRMVLEELAGDPDVAGAAGPPVVLLALGRDKDAPRILKTLRAHADRLVCTTVASGPLRAAETLAEEASRAGFVAETAAEPVSALSKALQLAGEQGWVLVIGSFYLAGAVRSLLDSHTQHAP